MTVRAKETEISAAAAAVACSGIDHLALRVSSLDRSGPYYAALLPLLGFAQVGAQQWRNAAGATLIFAEAEEGSRPYHRLAPGMNHVGFSVPSPDAVEMVRAAMAAAGFDVPEIEHFPGAVALFMADPDGIRFEIGCQSGEEGE